MEAASLHVSALDDHPDTISNTRVAWCAVDVVALLPAFQHLLRCWERQTVAFFSIHQTGVEVRIFMQLIPRDCVFNLRAHRAAIRIEIRSTLREELWLVLHILAATHHNQQR